MSKFRSQFKSRGFERGSERSLERGSHFRSESRPYLPRCACCHFAKYASNSGLDLTVGEYVEYIWPNCACGEQCEDYSVFLTAMHKIRDIPIKQYFCSGKNPDFRHQPWHKQRISHNRQQKPIGLDFDRVEFNQSEFNYPKSDRPELNYPKSDRPELNFARSGSDRPEDGEIPTISVDLNMFKQLSDEVSYLRQEIQAQQQNFMHQS